MAQPKVTIGGEVVKSKGVEAIKDLTENRTMIVQKMTQKSPSIHEIVEDLKCVEDVFNYFKPKAEIPFTDWDGSVITEEVYFNSIEDFRPKVLTKNSIFLGRLQVLTQAYQQIIRELEGNSRLKKLLTTEKGRENLVKILSTLILELEENESLL